MESALILFGEKGYELTTIDDIGAKSGISKGMVYTYFKSKEDLYITLMDQRTNHTFNILKERFEELDTAEQKIIELLRIYREAENMEEWSNSIRVHMEFWLNSSRQEHLKNIMKDRYKKQFRAFLMQIIQEGQDNGEFKKDIQMEIVASLFWAIIDGICLHYTVVGKEYNYKEHFLISQEMILQYILISKK
nr:TetR/AcrR family transcriptional regulator [Bacillus sp. FJAT-49736]